MSTASPPPDAPPPEAPRPRIGGAKAALGVLGTVGLLGLLLTQTDPARIGALLSRAHPGWLALGLGLYVALQLVRALRYRGLAPEASPRVLVGVHFVHALLLRVMPFRTGELGFAWLMRRHGAGGFTRNLVGVLLLRVLDLTTIVAVFAVSVVVLGAGAAASRGSLIAVAVAGAIAALAPLYVRGLLRLGHGALALALRLSGLSGRAARLERALADAVGWVGGLSRGLLWRLSALTTAQWAVNFVLFGVLMAAMRAEVTVAEVLLGGAGSVLGGLLPLAGVGNFGPLEAGWAVGFEAAGVPRATAVASAFGFSVTSFGYAALTGAAGWLLLRAARDRD